MSTGIKEENRRVHSRARSRQVASPKQLTGCLDQPAISRGTTSKVARSKKKTGQHVKCTLCGKSISDRRNLNRHLRSVHNVQPKVRKLRKKCPYSDKCSFVCATNTILRHHLETVHDFTIIQKNLHFENWSYFEKWKEEEEVRTFSSYVTDTGVKCRNEKKIYYLRCHRSGLVRAEESEKKERLRSKPLRGYTQCGFTCPSSMQVVESKDGGIDVCYFPKHLGHIADHESVKYMKLRRKEKEEIAAKLVQGEPINKILLDARCSRSPKLSRVHFLRRRDVYNIKSKVTYLENNPDRYGKIIESWVDRLRPETLDNNPIVLYKPIEEDNDYMLVIIHEAQKKAFSLLFDGSIIYVKSKKGKANVDFNLIAVFAINENGDGFPLAFCVSSKIDYSTVSTFFNVIFNSFGSIKAQIFISDNYNYYYSAWKKLMGETENKLICNFDIHSHWDQRLLELKCPFAKHEAVTEKLKSLLHESDPDVFESELVHSLNSWAEDEDLKPIVELFYKHYCKRPLEWANCYRVHSVRKENINNYLKGPYDCVNKIYAQGIRSAPSSLLLLIRNECYMNLIKLDEDVLRDKVKEVEKNHAASKEIRIVVPKLPSYWIVMCAQGRSYVACEETDCGKDCGVVCNACDICIHQYRCSCADFRTNFSICCHIHAVVTYHRIHPSEEFTALSPHKRNVVSLSKPVTEYVEEPQLTEME